MNWSRKTIVFVPGCLLCPSLQAGEDEKNFVWTEMFRAVWEKYPVGLVQMPCPEAEFPTGLSGLGRPAHGIRYYENLAGFSAHCAVLARQTAGQILSFQQAGYKIAAVMGIEHSPTCAVRYMYTHQGTVRRTGLYLDALINALAISGTDVTYIGINRTYPRKAVKELEDAILAASGDAFEVKREV